MLFSLAVVGMESIEKGPGVTLDQLRMLRDRLMGRLEVLGPGDVVIGLRPGKQVAFTTMHKYAQQGLLQGQGAGRGRAREGCRGGR